MGRRIRTPIEAASMVLEESHRNGKDFLPMIEGSKNGEAFALLIPRGWDTWEEKTASFSESILGLVAIGCDGFCFISDAHLSIYDATDGVPDDVLPPSQDPKAVDALIAIEWKGGRCVSTTSRAYRIDDNGNIEWDEARISDDDGDYEGWMTERVADIVEVVTTNPPPKVPLAVVCNTLTYMGHTVSLIPSAS